ncbi:bridge-like lipid transfer protein family member 3B [Ptychodera flava]|uniref:bridge-like lipid transfer protein family member 3B n=1 Tax=Ptychodera flava TaxID=63121 RepID=UPI00396A8A75
MAGILKKQITKHLSKFAKNLTADKINISTLKGEGELHNLELNEEVLMDLMDLPLWITLTKAKCNRVSFKIPWTKLKTTPAHIHLDRVEVEMRVVQDFRTPSEQNPLHSSGGKYSLSDRVIDGLYVSVNEISMAFKSHAFHASILMSQFSIRSTKPDWSYTNDLHDTRIRDKTAGELLNFKEAQCQTVRINVDALRNEKTTPILVITYDAKIRFAIKKRLEDCQVITSNVKVVLTDILLVLTDSQLKAAVEFLQMMSGLNQKAQDLVKADTNILSQSKKIEQQATSKNQEAQRTQEEQYFHENDIIESSYHISIERVDMHLVDEQNRGKEETYKRRTEGGAMKLNIRNLSLDFYPYHVYNTDRSHWENYDLLSETMEKRDTWAKHLLANFRQQVKIAREQGRPYLQDIKHNIQNQGGLRGQSSEVTRPRTNSELGTQQALRQIQRPQTIGYNRNMDVVQVNRPRSQSELKPANQPIKGQHQIMGQTQRKQKRQPKLMENCMILRLEDFAIYAVSTEGSTDANKKFFYSDKETFSLPPEMSSIHMEITSYYFPEGLEYPVPEANMFWQLNPLRLDIDYTTILWINQFANLMATGVQTKSDSDSETSSTTGSSIGSDMDHVDIRIDALMPKITIPSEQEVKDEPERPKALQIQFSQVTLSNCRIGTQSSISDLASAVQNIYGGKLFTNLQQFPNEPWDLNALPQMLWNHAYKHEETNGNGAGNGSAPIAVHGKSSPQTPSVPLKVTPPPVEKYKKEPVGKKAFFKPAAEDVWCIHCDQVWLDFLGIESAKDKPVPFVESIPMELWACFPSKEGSAKEGSEIDLQKKFESRNAEPSHLDKRRLFGHRKAASVSYPIGRSMSPTVSDVSGEFSSSMSDLMSSPGSGSQQSLRSSSLSGSHGYIMSQGDTGSLPLHNRGMSGSFTPPKISHSHPGTPSGDMPPSSKGLHDSGMSQSQSSSSLSSSLTSGVALSNSEVGSYPGLGSMESSYSSSLTSDSALGSMSTSASHIPSISKPGTYSVDSSDSRDENIADTHLIVEAKGKLRIILNRQQYLFLMRLVDSLVKMSDAIEEDIVMFQGKSDKVSSIVIAARLQAAELTLVLPPLPGKADDADGDKDATLSDKDEIATDVEKSSSNNHGEESSMISMQDPSVLSENTTDAESATDAESTGRILLNGTDETPSKSTMNLSSESLDKGADQEENQSFNADSEFVLLDLDDDDDQEVKIGNPTLSFQDTAEPLGKDSEFDGDPSQSKPVDSLVRDDNSINSVPGSNLTHGDGSTSGSSVLRYRKGDDDTCMDIGEIATDDANALEQKDSVSANDKTPKDFLESMNQSQGTVTSSASQMSESASDSDAIGSPVGKRTGSMSNLYDDDDELLAELEVERTQDAGYQTVDATTQTGNDEDKQNADDGQSSDLVSVMNVQLSDLQAGVQLFGDKTGIKFTLGKVVPDEQGNVNYQEYLENRISESNRRREDPLPSLTKSENPVAGIRMSLGEAAERYSPGATKHLGVQVDGLDAQVLMASVTGLVEMIDDSETGGGEPMPIDVSVAQANFKLLSSLVAKNEAASETQKIPSEHSEIQGAPTVSETPSEGAPSSVASSPPEGSISEVTSPSSESSVVLEEMQQLREQLEMTRSALSTVEQERASLLKSLCKLQDELIDVERERENMRQEVVRLKSLKRSSSTLSLK